MRIFLSQISLVFLVFMALSCKKNKHEGEVHNLDSLYQSIIIIEKRVTEVDLIEVKRTYEEIVRNVKFVRQDYTGPFNEKAIELFTEYKNIRKPINNFYLNREELLKELNYTKKQLETLAFDLKKGSIPEEKASEYYHQECSAAKEIHTKSVFLVDSLTDALKKFKEMHPKVQEFINENIINQPVSSK